VKSLSRLLHNEHWDLKMSISRYGMLVQEVLLSISKHLKNAKSRIVDFGSRKMELREILAAEKLENLGFKVNLITRRLEPARPIEYENASRLRDPRRAYSRSFEG
jgi:hypothetical protein